MRLISHRGNVNGPKPNNENDPSYIDNALAHGFDVEVDLWYQDQTFFLGHTEPQYAVPYHYVAQPRLWIHCKHYQSFERLVLTELNFFYHTNEDYVLTSHRYIWAYPGNSGGTRTICVLPETTNTPVNDFWGVCSDYIEKYR